MKENIGEESEKEEVQREDKGGGPHDGVSG